MWPLTVKLQILQRTNQRRGENWRLHPHLQGTDRAKIHSDICPRTAFESVARGIKKLRALNNKLGLISLGHSPIFSHVMRLDQ